MKLAGGWSFTDTAMVTSTIFDDVIIGRCSPVSDKCGVKMLCKVCKKVSRLHSARVSRHIGRTLAEIRDLRAFSMVNVVYFGFGWLEDDDSAPVYAIVMEYCERNSLRELLDVYHYTKHAPNIFQLMIGVAVAILNVHELQPARAYGAVTSSNLFVTARGVVKLSMLPMLDPWQCLTSTQSAVKSSRVRPFSYLAPELLREQCNPFAKPLYSQAADIYAVGIVLWEILTGKAPYEFVRRDVVIEHVLSRHREPVSRFLITSMSHQTERSLTRIVNACRRHTPARRLTATGLLECLLHASEEAYMRQDTRHWSDLIHDAGLTMGDLRRVHLANAQCPAVRKLCRSNVSLETP